MKIALRKPVTYEEVSCKEIDLDMDRLTGADALAVSRQLRREQPKDPVMQPETDDRYILAIAARAARVPVELFSALSLADFARVKLEVQGFLLGSTEETSPET